MKNKVCYRLWVDDSFIEKLTIEQYKYMEGIDEDFTSKKEWLKTAKKYTNSFNTKFNTNFIYQDFFGECKDIGWRKCAKCGDTYWKDDSHDCL